MSQYFGPFLLRGSEIFYTTKLSLAIVNLRPVVKGHVLVLPKRVVPRFGDLNPEETTDLFQTVHKVSKVIEQAYHSTSLSITIQDGPHAGQTVPHVHVHILPRTPGDFARNDDIYTEIENNKCFTVESDSRNRTPEEMQQESKFLEGFFS
jgi:bis(5'-adenosyl)-triphosphatase